MQKNQKIYWRKPVAPPTLDGLRAAVQADPIQTQQAIAAHLQSLSSQYNYFPPPLPEPQREHAYSVEQAEEAARQAQAQNKRYMGVVKRFDPKKSFGFISCSETRDIYGRDVFLHKNDMPRLEVGDTVTFEVWLNEKKMPQARTVKKVVDPNQPGPHDGNPLRLDIGLMTQDELHGAFSAFSASLKEHVGRLVKFDDAKGFGFIDCPELFAVYGRQVFAHTQQVRESSASVGDMVTFSVELNDKGYPQARKMKVRKDSDSKAAHAHTAAMASLPPMDAATLQEQQAEAMLIMQEQYYQQMAQYDQLDEVFDQEPEEPAAASNAAEEPPPESWQEQVERFVKQRQQEQDEEDRRRQQLEKEEEELKQRLLQEQALKEKLAREEKERQEKEREEFLRCQQDEEEQERRKAEQEERRQQLRDQLEQEQRAMKDRIESTAVQHFKDRLDSALRAAEESIIGAMPGDGATGSSAGSDVRHGPDRALTVRDAFGIDDDADEVLDAPKRHPPSWDELNAMQNQKRSRSRRRPSPVPKGPRQGSAFDMKEPADTKRRPNRWDPEDVREMDDKRDDRRDDRRRRTVSNEGRRRRSSSKEERRRRRRSRSRRISRSRSAFRRRNRSRTRSRSDFRSGPRGYRGSGREDPAQVGPKQLQASSQVPPGGYRYKEILVPQQFVARLIGKGGTVVQSIHQQSGADIKIRQETQAFGYSKAIVTGAAAAVEAAEQLIQKTLGISGEPGFAKKELDVAAEHVSALIGPAGSIIQDMRARAGGLQIEIRGPQVPGAAPHKAILGPGRADQISIAEQLILQKVAEFEMDLALKLQASVDSNMHRIPCKFHAVGRCTKGAMCPFSHPGSHDGAGSSASDYYMGSESG
mmetsp:Transcript_8954/g.23310  ORF Transcript_8954/g.23310 Transcript_8954/m.23310 type:complete len:868 (+) Transcript_8954:224-2827(+)